MLVLQRECHDVPIEKSSVQNMLFVIPLSHLVDAANRTGALAAFKLPTCGAAGNPAARNPYLAEAGPWPRVLSAAHMIRSHSRRSMKCC